MNSNDPNNITGSAIPVVIAGVTYNVQPEVLAEKYKEYKFHNSEIDNHKESIKLTLEDAEGDTGIPKKILKRFFSERYKQTLDEQKQAAEAVNALRAVVEAQ